MSLRKSPVRTPAMLAANRANALKCTGPRTLQGKARVALNGVKHGRHAWRLRENLAKAASREGEQLYQWLLGEICLTFEPRGRHGRQQAAWSEAWRALRKAKPECPLESEANNSQLSPLLRIRIDDAWRRRGLVFWLQRHRHWTFDRWMKLVEDAVAGKPREGPVRRWGRTERRLRVRRFRLARPGLWEQQALEQARRKRAARVDQRSTPSPLRDARAPRLSHSREGGNLRRKAWEMPSRRAGFPLARE